MAEKQYNCENAEIKQIMDYLLIEFESWQEVTGSEEVFLLECLCDKDDSGCVTLNMLLSGEHEFKVHCYIDKTQERFEVTAEPSMRQWASSLNQFLMGSLNQIKLSDVLNKAVSLHVSQPQSEEDPIDTDGDSDESEESEEDFCFQSNSFEDVTEWDIMLSQKKKRWAQVSETMMIAKLTSTEGQVNAYSATSREKKQAQQIFTSSAASGILTNDLVNILETKQDPGFSVEPIDDNIYLWKVKLYGFDPDSELQNELIEVEKKFGYNYIELELTFDIGLYPFFPPLLKVIRPRMKGALMQQVTNMDLLKLSHWLPTKDMKSVVLDIKQFLQKWARIEVACERNDLTKYPHSSFLKMEHHLSRLALLSEMTPRVNIEHRKDEDSPECSLKPPSPPKLKKVSDFERDEFWAAGVGFGHSKQRDWDISAYLAAQTEKDHQVESVLDHILQELRDLYANHAPQLKPRQRGAVSGDSLVSQESIDPVVDMYNIIEGSALIPFIEQNLKADSFLEITRHGTVYKAIIDILKEITLQSQLLPLVCSLPNQQSSVYQLLEAIQEKASIILRHVGKFGNGSVPKPGKTVENWEPSSPLYGEDVGVLGTVATPSSEERMARDFTTLFRDMTDALKRNKIPPLTIQSSNKDISSLENNAPKLTTFFNQHTEEYKKSSLESKYKEFLRDHVFGAHEIDVEGPKAHHFSSFFNAKTITSPSQVLRVAQEISCLASSLPLTLSSAIFVRTDDEKLSYMRALITGPEGTPYSGGCFLFDIYFGDYYPSKPPLVNLQTTGGGTVRFNPNLYSCGQVCLSLLGTWPGQKGEQWNEKTSTVLQVLVSIQSLILVSEPFFNEPGFEQEIGTPFGEKHSQEYNADVQINTVRHAMVGVLQSPPQGFEEVVKIHFYLKKEKILQEVKGWLIGCKKGNRGPLEKSIQNLETELNKLEHPANMNTTIDNDDMSSQT